MAIGLGLATIVASIAGLVLVEHYAPSLTNALSGRVTLRQGSYDAARIGLYVAAVFGAAALLAGIVGTNTRALALLSGAALILVAAGAALTAAGITTRQREVASSPRSGPSQRRAASRSTTPAERPQARAAASTGRSTHVLGQLELKPVNSGDAEGVALFVQRGPTRSLVVSAKLRATRPGQAYEIWLYNSRSDARSLGAQVSDSQGSLQGASTVPADLDIADYRFIDVSLEHIDHDARHSGDSVLRGALADLRPPSQRP